MPLPTPVQPLYSPPLSRSSSSSSSSPPSLPVFNNSFNHNHNHNDALADMSLSLPLSHCPSSPSSSSSSSPSPSYRSSPSPSHPVFSNSSNSKQKDELKWERIGKLGTTLGLALFGASTALFLSGPPAPNEIGALYAAYLTLIYLAIVTSYSISLFFFILLGTSLVNWKINCFIGISGLFLLLACSIRLTLSLPHVYTPYVWLMFVIVSLLTVFCFWYNYPLTNETPAASLPAPGDDDVPLSCLRPLAPVPKREKPKRKPAPTHDRLMPTPSPLPLPPSVAPTSSPRHHQVVAVTCNCKKGET